MSSTFGVVRSQQRDWAIARAIAVDSDGCTLALDDNLFVRLSCIHSANRERKIHWTYHVNMRLAGRRISRNEILEAVDSY